MTSQNKCAIHFSTGSGTEPSGGGTTNWYAYDGAGLRVKKTTAATVHIFSGTKVIADYTVGAAPTSPLKEHFYSAGQWVATDHKQISVIDYRYSDHLGSARMNADSNGTVTGQQGHFPFGDNTMWYVSGTGGGRFIYTGYDYDAESGNHYAMMRYDVGRLGRFSSPDPLSGSIADPQSLNLFAYVTNDPVNFVDPLGLWKEGRGEGDRFANPFGWLTGWNRIFEFLFTPTSYIENPDCPNGDCAPGVPRTVPVYGNLSQLNARVLLLLLTAAKNLEKQGKEGKLDSGACATLLAALGITGNDVAAGAANAVFYDGTTSNASFSSLYENTAAGRTVAAQYAGITVAGHFATHPGTAAMAQLNGNNVYVNPSLIASAGALGTVFHEVIHNVSGLVDSEIQRRLGLPESSITSNITAKLMQDCFPPQ
jgi:RHS repeat-associated protein